MTQFFKTNISKETFKIANTECLKKAWVFHSLDHFKKTITLHQQQKFFFNLDNDLAGEDDFTSNGSSIDLFEEYTNSKLKTLAEQTEFEAKWKQAFNNDDGFTISEFQGDAIEDGREFGAKVIAYFEIDRQKNHPNKLTKDFNQFANITQAVEQTKLLLENEQNKYIYLYEPAFEFDNFNLKVRCDVLKLKGNNHVEIIEAKATTSVKKEHFWDLVYQAYVLEKNGYIVDNISICRLNKDYLYAQDYHYYFDFSEEIEKLDRKYFDLDLDFYQIKKVVDQLDELDLGFKDLDQLEDHDLERLVVIDQETYGSARQRASLFEDYKNLKKFLNLDDLFIKIADFLSLEDHQITSVFNSDSCFLQVDKKAKNWISWQLDETEKIACKHILKYFDQNIEGWWQLTGKNKDVRAYLIKHLSSPYFKDYQTLNDPEIINLVGSSDFFNETQNRIFELAKLDQEIQSDETLMIEDKNFWYLRQELSKYSKRPVFMYDFETVKFAVPRFYKTNPYYQTPFQYSIDVIYDDNYDYNQPQTMKHYQFLSNSVQDPRKAFVINFLKDIFNNHPGVYVAYNKSFEQRVLKSLACLFPKLEQALMYIVNNTIDLMDFFKGKKDLRPSFLIGNKNFHGLYSIKKTQPALDPNFSYKDLTINNGSKASEVFRRFLEARIDQQSWENFIKPDMINYCNRDTLAMVVILKRVSEIARKWELKHDQE
ncbi:DUF2779 domain-containing protein [Mycoplasma putrefaciens]|uniref:DUF2779 domain-containing protein n=1 Tax=Mycoplasma putrefaciens Mput9231 TaxID=1292033 RepID=M9WCI5_9MOLU|nr:DUF2779 domain-containing protein [Mycoplasma putrefaciens]AGJ90847.1 Hypothetical protein MPUT9231_4370 [Mycoplasma putrefaciens Mput9231]